MSYENWKNRAQGFQTVDVRHIPVSYTHLGRGGFLAGGSFYFGKLVRLKASIITLLLQERDK